MRSLSWLLLAAAAHAQYVLEGSSFGHKEGSIRPDSKSINGWSIQGEGHDLQLLSDRVILTAPHPGNTRGALWSMNPTQHSEWEADIHFRASGPERGTGNLQIWYTKDGRQGGISSLYTVGAFDGLLLEIDQVGGHGGSIRGFLNDGTVDYKSHHAVDTLAFGQCNYAYRNRGGFSILEVKQTGNGFEVWIDHQQCFSSEKVRLPSGYYFGISAATAESPDSFEVHQFVVKTTTGITRDESFQKQPPRGHAEAWQHHENQQQQQQEQPPATQSDPNVAHRLDDFDARLRSLTADVHTLLAEIQHVSQRQNEHMHTLEGKLNPIHEYSNAAVRMGERVQGIVLAIQKDLGGKDYNQNFMNLQNALRDTHSSLSASLPEQFTNIAKASAPRLGFLVFIFVIIQVVLVGSYMFYRHRRDNAPKKYL